MNISCSLGAKGVGNVFSGVGVGSCVLNAMSGRAKGQDGGGDMFAYSKAGKRGVDWEIFADVRSALIQRVRVMEGVEEGVGYTKQRHAEGSLEDSRSSDRLAC